MHSLGHTLRSCKSLGGVDLISSNIFAARLAATHINDWSNTAARCDLGCDDGTWDIHRRNHRNMKQLMRRVRTQKRRNHDRLAQPREHVMGQDLAFRNRRHFDPGDLATSKGSDVFRERSAVLRKQLIVVALPTSRRIFHYLHSFHIYPRSSASALRYYIVISPTHQDLLSLFVPTSTLTRHVSAGAYFHEAYAYCRAHWSSTVFFGGGYRPSDR